jgi:hypothetical protein
MVIASVLAEIASGDFWTFLMTGVVVSTTEVVASTMTGAVSTSLRIASVMFEGVTVSSSKASALAAL